VPATGRSLSSFKIQEIYDSEDDEADILLPADIRMGAEECAGTSAAAAAAPSGLAAAASLKRLLAPSCCLQRPRLLLCGAPGAGQQHVGPALLHALEGLPVHSIGLTSLLADPG
jgi:SpoVK/Ycf46/Vps4 family AAA+-type ATPase